MQTSAGMMYYIFCFIFMQDTAFVDCHLEISNPQCSCDSTFMAGPPTQCFAGDFEHARAKVTQFVSSVSDSRPRNVAQI